jgi:phage shock protein E
MNKTVLIDVRNPEEFKLGHREDAINFDLSLMIQGNLPDLPKDAKIEVYCLSGGRASIAKQILESGGFQDAENVGGYQV